MTRHEGARSTRDLEALAFCATSASLLLDAQIQRPTFKAETNYVEVTAIVTDANGRFVPGLTRDDFDLLEDGNPQRIEQVAVVDVPDSPASSSFAGHRRPLAPVDTASNAVEGRAYVIVLDHFHLARNQMPRVRAALRTFIEKSMQPHDLVSVVQLSLSPRASPFTSNKERLLQLAGVENGVDHPGNSASGAASNGFVADPGGRGAVGSAADAAERALDALGRVGEYFGGLQGRRKALLFFSDGMSIDLIGAASSSPAARDASDRAGQAIRAAIAQAQRADVSVYPIDARGLSAIDPHEPASVDSPRGHAWGSLRILADQTGGEAVLGFNRFETVFQRIVNDSSRYYVLGYYTAVPTKDKKFHSLTVRVRNRPVTVRARRGFSGSGATGSATLLTDWTRDGIAGLLGRPLPVAKGVRLTASASIVGRTATRARVQLTVEVPGRDLLVPAGLEVPADTAVDIGVLALDAAGTSSARHTERATFDLSQKDLGAILSEGWRYLADLELPAGPHQVRVGVVETGGNRSGSVFLEIDVPDLFNGSLRLGTILVGSTSAATMPTVGTTAVGRSIFPGPPVARREFERSDTLAAFVALYSNDAGRSAGIPVATTLRSTDGRVVWRHDVVHPAAPEIAHAVSVPLAELAPGAYLLCVEAPGLPAAGDIRTMVFHLR